MGRGRGSRSGKSSRVTANSVVASCGMEPKATHADSTMDSTTKLTPSPLVQAVDGSDTTPSTASPSHAGTAVSTPTSNGTLMASGEVFPSALDEDKDAEKMVNDLLSMPRNECNQPSTSRALPPRGPEPWGLSGAAATHVAQQDGTPSAKSVGYREQLRSRGKVVMQGSYLWRPMAETAVATESRNEASLNNSLPIAEALGLVWNDAGTTTYAVPPVAHSPFHAAVSPTFGGHFPVQPPMSPIVSAPIGAFDNGVDQLMAIAMPGFLGGLSNVQIEEQLRAAASQIDVYDD